MKDPLIEGCRILDAVQVKETFFSLFNKSAAKSCERFLSAQERLREEFHASIDLVLPENGLLRVAARFEFLTLDRTVNPDLAHVVENAGFMLLLRSVPMLDLPERHEARESHIPYQFGEDKDRYGKPVGLYELITVVTFEQKMERIYALQENHRSADLVRAADSAENLLWLISEKLMRKMPEDLPDNVVPMPRRSDPPLRREFQSGIFEIPEAGRKVS
jgi:hypothetical protein